MIGGQYLDTMEPDADLETVHRLKTGRLFYASVTLALAAAEVPGARATLRGARSRTSSACSSRSSTTSSTATASSSRSASTARAGSPTTRPRAHAPRSTSVDADTSVLAGIVDDLAVRTV